MCYIVLRHFVALAPRTHAPRHPESGSPWSLVPYTSGTVRLVAAAIIEREGRVLIARRSPASKLAGQWEFPGGKVEEGESLQACLARELHEELGIVVEVGVHFHGGDYHYDHGSFRIEAFRVRWMGETMTLTTHDRVEWVLPSELPGYDLLPADVPIAQELMSTAQPRRGLDPHEP